MNSTSATPNTMLLCCPRTLVCSTTRRMTAAPTMAPGSERTPPSTTIIRRATDVAQPNVGGLMKPFMCASRLPAAPAMAELTRSSVTLTRVTSTPDVRHAVSFSRMARSAVPNGECSSRKISTYSASKQGEEQVVVVLRLRDRHAEERGAGIPRNPMGPFVIADHWL